MPIPVNPPSNGKTFEGFLWFDKQTLVATIWFTGTYYHYKAATDEEITVMIDVLTDIMRRKEDILQPYTKLQVMQLIKDALVLDYVDVQYNPSRYQSRARKLFLKQEMTFTQAKNYVIKFGKYGKDKPQTIDQIAQIDLRYLDWLRGEMEKDKEKNKSNPTYKAICIYLDDPAIQRELDE